MDEAVVICAAVSICAKSSVVIRYSQEDIPSVQCVWLPHT